jgi:hypothetical protein
MNTLGAGVIILLGLGGLYLIVSGKADQAVAAFHAAAGTTSPSTGAPGAPAAGGSPSASSPVGPASTGLNVPNVSGTPATSLSQYLPAAFGLGTPSAAV